jgi:hypothetical protein
MTLLGKNKNKEVTLGGSIKAMIRAKERPRCFRKKSLRSRKRKSTKLASSSSILNGKGRNQDALMRESLLKLKQ